MRNFAIFVLFVAIYPIRAHPCNPWRFFLIHPLGFLVCFTNCLTCPLGESRFLDAGFTVLRLMTQLILRIDLVGLAMEIHAAFFRGRFCFQPGIHNFLGQPLPGISHGEHEHIGIVCQL